MPVNDFAKFKKLQAKNPDGEFDVEKTVSKTIEHTERIKMRNIQLTLYADDFFRGERGDVFASRMSVDNISPPHNHDFYEINYVISGKCVECIANSTIVLEEGDFLLMPPAVTHTPAPLGQSECVDILLRAEWIRDFEKKMLSFDIDGYLTKIQKQNSYMVFNAKDKPAFETAKLMRKYFSNKEQRLHFHQLYVSSLAQKLLTELAECPCTENFYKAPKLSATTDVLGAILQYINDNISTTDLASTAGYFGYSPSHLSRIIKKHTGNGFATYIMLQRMLHAEEYLIKTDIPIGKIPSLVGLESGEYFSRMFKKYNNLTPSEYRKIKRNSNV